jgi:hypothetical protein
MTHNYSTQSHDLYAKKLTENFDHFCIKYDTDKIHECLNYKFKPTREHIKILAQNYKFTYEPELKKILSLFEKIGYIFIKDDILLFIKSELDLTRMVDINDNEIDQIIKDKLNLMNFKKILLSMGLSTMKKEIIDNNITPDIECLHILSKGHGKKTHIEYLLNNYNLKIDIECVMRAYKCARNPSVQFEYMLQKYYDENKNK